MPEKTPRGFIDTLLRGAFAVFAVAIALQIAASVVRCNWGWIVGATIFAAVIFAVIHLVRSRDDGW